MMKLSPVRYAKSNDAPHARALPPVIAASLAPVRYEPIADARL